MNKEHKDIRSFNMRMPTDTWMFLKQQAALQQVSMTDIILRCIAKYQKKFDNKLTLDDTDV